MKGIEESLKSLGLDIPILVLDYDFKSDGENVLSFHELLDIAPSLEDPPKHEEPDYESICVFIWSSGTTGRPKAFQRTNKSFYFFAFPRTNLWKRFSNHSFLGDIIVKFLF